MYTYIYIYVCIHIYIYICMYTYICMYVCMYVCMYIWYLHLLPSISTDEAQKAETVLSAVIYIYIYIDT